ncbi:ubiquitin-conjugating enzyme E2-binding protein [Lipomyces kononenkoae]|uniref:Ubiquitin-conjugating enzyme E2-binding protein n=1 Tax=Lipomyces kononenkoae TaxID=34357 RepID=A0ACC3T1N6_LIPKO
MGEQNTSHGWQGHNIAYFAELLPHIAQISLTISPLDAVPIHFTRISSSKLYVKATSESAASIITLPGSTTKDVPISLQQLCQLNSDIKTGSVRLKAERDEREEHIVPLSARQLSDCKAVQCRECGADLLKDNVKFLDLPSENWYELLDYWHCHKPDHDHGHGAQNSISKHALKPRKSLALVGLAHIMTIKDDFVSDSIKVSGTQFKEVVCSTCCSEVGVLDKLDQSITKLYKWNIVVESRTPINDSITSIQYPPEVFLAEILLEVIEFHSTHRFTIAAHHDKERILIYLWVFSSDITYTSNLHPDPIRAMKVFYTTQAEASNPEIAAENIELPLSVVNNILKVLDTRNKELPGSLKAFGKWNVSLLHRL